MILPKYFYCRMAMVWLYFEVQILFSTWNSQHQRNSNFFSYYESDNQLKLLFGVVTTGCSITEVVIIKPKSSKMVESKLYFCTFGQKIHHQFVRNQCFNFCLTLKSSGVPGSKFAVPILFRLSKCQFRSGSGFWSVSSGPVPGTLWIFLDMNAT